MRAISTTICRHIVIKPLIELFFIAGCAVMFFVVSKELIDDYAGGQLLESWVETTYEEIDIDFPTIAICAKRGFRNNTNVNGPPMFTEDQYLQNTFDIQKLVFKSFTHWRNEQKRPEQARRFESYSFRIWFWQKERIIFFKKKHSLLPCHCFSTLNNFSSNAQFVIFPFGFKKKSPNVMSST